MCGDSSVKQSPPASRPSLSCYLLFTEENIVDPQETAFVKTEERFVVNSLLVEIRSTHVYMEGTLAPVTSRGKMTIMVKERSIHRAKELAAELQGWSSSSLREVLLTCGVWEEGMRSLAPDKPRIV